MSRRRSRTERFASLVARVFSRGESAAVHTKEEDRSQPDKTPVPAVAPEPAPEEYTAPLDLDRVEKIITGPMGYQVQRHEENGHPCLLGTWDSYPFVIEEPEGHDGWLMVFGDWENPAGPGERDELASSVNDWNRDRFFPTVALVDGPEGSYVRAAYLTDLTAGVNDAQLMLHLDTALSSCTEALRQVRPLLPEL